MKQYSYDSLNYDPAGNMRTKMQSTANGEIASDIEPPAMQSERSHTPWTMEEQTPSPTPDEYASLRTPSITKTPQPVDSDESASGSSSYPPTQSTSVEEAETSSSSSKGMSEGATVGVFVAVACVMCIVAAFVFRKTQAKRTQSKYPPAFGGSKEMPIAKTELSSPGSFGKLNSRRNGLDKKDMSDGSNICAVVREDPFTRRQMHKGGIWDDPVLAAARIPLEKIQIQELIARGGFGQVFMASYKGKTVAVKTLLPETAQDMAEINALFTEIKVMAKLEHPCIVRFIGIAWESLSTVCCVTEYLVGGDLRALLNHFLANQTRSRGFDHDKVKIALNIVDGLTYLHSLEPNILHRDLKSRNVLLTSQLEAKLTDFGVSRERSDDRMTNAVGTSLWMAPEIIIGGHYDGKADIYSFGVLLSELDRHDLPYTNVKDESGRRPTDTVLLQMVAAGKLQVEFSDDCPQQVLTLARECIAVDPNKRPSAADALSRLQNALKTFEVEEVAL